MKKIITFFLAQFVITLTCLAQPHREFLATVDYSPFSYSRLDSIPGVYYVQDGSAYDENNKRFFLQGTDINQTLPNILYVLDANTGNVITQNQLGANLGPGYRIACMQYDKSVDTLYCLAFTGTSFSFGWIDPLTGIVTIRSALPMITGYAIGISAIDVNHHYLFAECVTTNGIQLFAFHTLTGTVAYQNQVSTIAYLEYDNTNNHLYGIGAPGQLDSIDYTTGTLYPIGNVTQLGLYQTGISAINETTQEFIFVALCSSNANDSLFVLNMQTGAIINRYDYNYANAANPALENIVFYRMDQQTQVLYALNWGIDSIPVNPDNVTETDTPVINIYPNPAVDQMTIADAGTYDYLNIYDVNGKLIFVIQTLQRNTFDIGFLAAGQYSLELASDERRTARTQLVVTK
jgi:outer membrane protein assembly factor BamB